MTFLSDAELDLVLYVERFHASMGTAPNDEQLKARFSLTHETIEAFKANELVKKSFAARGILYPPAEDRFTPEQMHAAAVMTDLVDRRSDVKKLGDLGISTRQWSTWLQDDAFAQYLKDRSEKLLENSVHETHKGLLKGVRNGNVAAVKLAYEITGRYRPDAEQQIDVRRILHTMIEVIQKFVKDPIVLHQIAMELSSVASTESYSANIANNMISSRTVQGSVVPVSTPSSLPTPPPIEEFE